MVEKRPQPKDVSLFISCTNTDCSQNACLPILWFYRKGIFMRRKRKITLDIFYFPRSFMAIVQVMGIFLLPTSWVLQSSKNTNDIILKHPKNKVSGKGLGYSNNQNPDECKATLKTSFWRKELFNDYLFCFLFVCSFVC